MPTVYLGLGSNLGDRAAALRGALDAVATLPHTQITGQSPAYETAPMGPQDQGPYLNMAAQIQTTLSPDELIQALQGIEAAMGRATPDQRRYWGPREIDIDLLLYGDERIDTPALTVPHPGLAERWFVLKPLADLAPDLMHPTLSRSIAELLSTVEAVQVKEATP